MASSQTTSPTICVPAAGRIASAAAKRKKFPRPAAFTLVEMLVVIGIIVVIIGIALPMLNRAWKNAVKARMAADLQTISTGLEAYRADFKDYPRVDYSVIGPGGANGINPATVNSGLTANIPGAVVLCWALLSPGPDAQDGADGPGFRVHSLAINSGGSTGQGQLYGPYIAPGRFNIGEGINDYDSTINDRYGHPYLYFPANRGGIPASSYVAAWTPTQGPPIPMYNATDGLQAFRHGGETDDTLSLPRLQAMMGDLSANNEIDGSETAAYTGPYVLWGAGPDEQYGPNVLMAGSPNTFDLSNCDDVTNFK